MLYPLYDYTYIYIPPSTLTQVQDHRGCCEENSNSTLFDPASSSDFTVGEEGCRVPNPYYNWDKTLGDVADTIHMVNLMEDLGRRRRCLRGCVNEEQVRCTNIVTPKLG